MTEPNGKRSRWYWSVPDPGKVSLFARLLTDAFPDGQLDHGPDLYPDCWAYCLTTARGAGPAQHRVIVMREFLEFNDLATISKRFHDWRLPKMIGARASVLVTEAGPDVNTPESD